MGESKKFCAREGIPICFLLRRRQLLLCHGDLESAAVAVVVRLSMQTIFLVVILYISAAAVVMVGKMREPATQSMPPKGAELK